MSVDAYLLQDYKYKIDFKSTNSNGKIESWTSQITMLPEHVSIVNSKELSWDFCHRLRQYLAGLEEDQRQFKCVISTDDFTQKAKICLEGPWINHLVDKIGISMKLKVSLRSIEIWEHSSWRIVKDEMFTAGMVPHYSCNDWVLMYESSLYNAPDNWVKTAHGRDFEISARLSITMSGLPDKPLKKPFPMSIASVKAGQSMDWALFSSKIFTEQFETDVEIVSADGSKHPCHQLFLTGNSPVFHAMFKGDSFKEGQTKSVALKNMSENGVVALLNYLYCIESKDGEAEAEHDSGICMELLQASEQYSMSNLQETMKSVFLNKPSDWFQIDTTLKLFCFSRNVTNCQELMAKCIQVLKSKHEEVKTSEDYKKLFIKNPEAAMDLCNFTLSK